MWCYFLFVYFSKLHAECTFRILSLQQSLSLLQHYYTNRHEVFQTLKELEMSHWNKWDEIYLNCEWNGKMVNLLTNDFYPKVDFRRIVYQIIVLRLIRKIHYHELLTWIKITIVRPRPSTTYPWRTPSSKSLPNGIQYFMLEVLINLD